MKMNTGARSLICLSAAVFLWVGVAAAQDNSQQQSAPQADAPGIIISDQITQPQPGAIPQVPNIEQKPNKEFPVIDVQSPNGASDKPFPHLPNIEEKPGKNRPVIDISGRHGSQTTPKTGHIPQIPSKVIIDSDHKTPPNPKMPRPDKIPYTDIGSPDYVLRDRQDEEPEPEFVVPADLDQRLASIPHLPPNIKVYLEEKYSRVNRLSSTLIERPDGLLGGINIGGDLTPKDLEAELSRIVASQYNNREEKASALAWAFIREEAGLLGVYDISEYREAEVETTVIGPQFPSSGDIYTDVRIKRYIGHLPINNSDIKNSDIRITIGPNERIVTVVANPYPAGVALYTAVSKKGLTKNQIRKIVRQSLKTEKATQIRAENVIFEKLVTHKPPYVVWHVLAGDWEYTIDAFTGEILRKQSTIIWN